jgi:hypothetical protein
MVRWIEDGLPLPPEEEAALIREHLDHHPTRPGGRAQ